MKKTIITIIICLAISGCSINDLASTTDLPDAIDVQKIQLKNTFEQASAEYTINYPTDWATEEVAQRKDIVVFSGQQGEESHLVIVKVQELKIATGDDPGYKTPDDVMSDLKMQMVSRARDVNVYDQKIFIYEDNDFLELEGKEQLLEFTKEDKRIREWQIVIPDPNNEIFYYWAYNAPIDLFDKYLDTAKAMLNSWKISE